MHGEEVAGIIELCDQSQLLLDHAAHFQRHRIRIAADKPLFCQFAQAVIWLQPIGNLVRIFVAQLIQREWARLGNPCRIGDRVRIGMKQPAQFELGLDPPLGIRQSAAAKLIYGGLLTNAGQDIGQHQARGGMHDDIAKRDRLKPQTVRQRMCLGKARCILAIILRRQTDKDMIVKSGFQFPQRVAKGRTAKPDQDTLSAIIQHIFEREFARSFHGPALAERQQAAELTKSLPVARIGQQLGPVHQNKPGGDEIAKPEISRRTMTANNAGKRILVGNGQPTQPNLAGPGDQLLGMRGASQEGEIAGREQFHIGHGNSPATYQSSVASPG